MRRVALLLAMMVLALPVLGTGSDGIKNNLCSAQIEEIVAKRFGQQVERIEYRFKPYQSRRGGFFEHSEALAYVQECGGYHFFNIYGDEYFCDGDVNRFPRAAVIYRSSGDGC